MLDLNSYFVILYSTVLEKESRKFKVTEKSIRNAIQIMKEVYLPDPSWKSKCMSNSHQANYNGPAVRCAYLHKYAMCYTGLVYFLMQNVLLPETSKNKIFWNFYRKLGNQSKQRLHICSLGGGPGTDVVGVLASLGERFGDFPVSVSVIDLAGEWRSTFSSIVQELYLGQCDALQSVVSSDFFEAYYYTANLLADWSDTNIKEVVMSADIITMVKFISAAACSYKTKAMVKRIFDNMKPGAMLFFIDNAAGGFDRMMQEVAFECHMDSIYGPLLHFPYENSKFSITRFGYTSQSKTKIVFEVFQKPIGTCLNFFQEPQVRNKTSNRVRTEGKLYPETYQFGTKINRKRHQVNYEEESSPLLIFIIFVVFVAVFISIFKK